MDYKTTLFIILSVVILHFLFAVAWLIYKVRNKKMNPNLEFIFFI